MIKASMTAVILILFLSVSPASAQRDGDPPRERLGARASYIGTAGTLESHFGYGYDLTLYFTERLFSAFYLEIRIGATYLGDVNNQDLGTNFLRAVLPAAVPEGVIVAADMRLAYLALGPQYTWPVSETHTLYASLGMGIYSVSMYFDTGVQAANFSDQNFGVNGGGGLLWRITKSFNLELNVTLHRLWTKQDELYFIFTEGGQNPWLLGVGFGAALDLR